MEIKYPILSDGKILTTKDWAAGSKEKIEHNDCVVKIDEKGELFAEEKVLVYPPAMYKCIDEIVNNALDHFISHPGEVTCIQILFDPVTCKITITNNGPGIDIEYHPKAKMYVPQLIFGHRDRGSNMHKSAESITGGVNGLGAKVTNAHSKEFIVETVKKTKEYFRYYFQKWTDRMECMEEPQIIELKPKDRHSEYTTISFILDNELFEYKELSEMSNILDIIISTRAAFASAYCSGKCDVKYNNVRMPITNISNIAQALYKNMPIITTTIMPKDKYPWDITVVITPRKIHKMSEAEQYTIVNGIIVKHGQHITFLMDQIEDAVKDSVIKLLKNDKIAITTRHIYDNVVLFASIKLAGVKWNAQEKSKAMIKKSKMDGYIFDKHSLKAITEPLKEIIAASILSKHAINSSKASIVKIDPSLKYERASQLGPTAKLLLPEGDSAKATCIRGFGDGMLNHKDYGILTLGGVIINARKSSSTIVLNGEEHINTKRKLEENKFWIALQSVIGLDVRAKYDKNSATYAKEMKKLKYGCIIACVDQDHDGVGFIFPLILNIFDKFWPNLLAAGFVKRFATPIMRAKPKRGGVVQEFYTITHYNKWRDSQTAEKLATYNIEYFKGLGSNDIGEVKHMFTQFNNNVFTFFPDPNSSKQFEIMFGDDPALRRTELSIPIEPRTEQVELDSYEYKRVSCTDLLLHEAKEHANANNIQTMWSAIDGLNESGRKILNGSYKVFISRSEKVKVAQLHGYIACTENYMHGEDNLDNNIKGKAFLDVGGIQLPMFIPYGEFGSRARGGSDSASARYVFVKYNKRLMNKIFPPQDRQLLEYTFSEGKRGEPKYFIPVIPMAILEHAGMPGTGWDFDVWARDVRDVIKKVKYMILTSDMQSISCSKIYSRGFTGKFSTIRGELYSFGSYYYDEIENCVNVTELPLRVWTDTWIAHITKTKKLVAEICNMSANERLFIKIYLQPHAYIEIEKLGDSLWTDGFEEYFELRSRMTQHLNYITENQIIKEFSTYADVLYYWFPFRKQMYTDRIEREVLMLKLQIEYYENIIRFVDEKPDIVHKKRIEADKILAEAKYIKFNEGIIKDPRYIPTNQIEAIVKGLQVMDIEEEASIEDEEGSIDSKQTLASYNYLLKLNGHQKLQESIIKRQNKLESLKKQLADLIERSALGRFIGANIWYDELTEIEEVINEGEKTQWFFDEKKKFKYS